MSFSTERKYIELRFNYYWAGATPIKWNNIDFKSTPKQTFVEFDILSERIKKIDLLTTRRYYGLIMITINTPINTGTKASRVLAGTAAEIFRDKTFDGIVCNSSSISEAGERNGWYRIFVTIPFYREATH